uniref:Uncharacterized protein n=1 Tax=Callorhinchus milii TaxID=7868 RepID=A0A4W3GBB8_CALMI
MLVAVLLLPVQLPDHQQIRVLGAVGPGAHLEREVLVGGERVVVERIVPHVRIHGAVQGEPGTHRGALVDLHRDDRPGEAGRVVVDVQHLHLDLDQLQVLGGQSDHVEGDGAGGGVGFAQPLPVDALGDADPPVLLPHREQRGVQALHHPKALGGRVQLVGQGLRQRPEHRAHRLLLVHPVLHGDGRRLPAQAAEQHKAQPPDRRRSGRGRGSDLPSPLLHRRLRRDDDNDNNNNNSGGGDDDDNDDDKKF